MFDSDFTSTTTPSSTENSINNETWQTLKNKGREQYENSNYSGALVSFRKALKKTEEQNNAPRVEHQILLSNIIACRLKIGGTEMAIVAVEEAKKCIDINNKWAKAHIRLASAYIAIGNRSNDACQALQNAIRLDPTNSIAKQMLMNELRRDNHNNNNSNARTDRAGELDEDDSLPYNANENDHLNNNTRPSPSAPSLYDDDIDDSPTFIQRIQDRWQRAIQWYQYDASDNWKSLLQIIAFILILYIAFGGRFGFENSLSNRNRDREYSSSGAKMGNYGDGNAYDQFYHGKKEMNSGHASGNTKSYGRKESESWQHNDDYKSQHTNSYYGQSKSYSDDDSSYNRYRYHEDRHRYGYGNKRESREGNNKYRSSSNSDWDTIIPYVLVGGIVIILNKLLGIPIHTLLGGFGMNRGFGGFGRRVRFGGGGIRFGGFPMGVFGGARGRGVNYRRRGW